MRKKYKVVVRVNSSLRIKDEGGRMDLDFNAGQIKARCIFRDIVKDEYGTKIHKYIQVEVELFAENINLACQLAANITDFFLSLASFSSGASVSIPKVH